MAALVFNWSSAMTCSTFAKVEKVNFSARAPPWRNWQKQILRNISSVPIIRALFGPCGWRWLQQGTTFEWSQQIRKQIMRSLKFWKANYSTIYAPVHHIQLLPQWDLQSINLIFNDKITNSLLLIFRQSTPRFQIMNSVVCQMINIHWHHLKANEHHHDNGARGVETFPCETWGAAAVGKAGKLEIYFRSKEIIVART